MSSTVVPAILYMVYALCFLVLCVMLGQHTSSEMYEAAFQRFVDAPFRDNPDKTIFDVSGGSQIYEWIANVFLPELYKDHPTPLDRHAFCSEESQCLLGEGDVEGSGQCAGPLVAGRNNCPSFMGSGTDCCEACEGSNCSDFTVATGFGVVRNTTSAPDISKACADTVPSWLRDLSQWNRLQSGSGRRLQAGTVAGADVGAVFCPERLSKVPSDIKTRTSQLGKPLVLARYNRVLMGRVTLKRAGLAGHASKAFANANPTTLSSARVDAYAHSSYDENTDSFGDPGRAVYIYEDGKGFYQTGGFVQHIDFDTSQDQVMEQMATLKRHHWFDLNQGSFVLEVLAYNGNVDKFLYVAFIFEHDFSGSTQVTVSAYPLDLTLHDFSSLATWARFLFYLVILALFVYFVKSEFEDMSADWTNYFADWMAVVQLASLVLCAYCIVKYLTVCVSYSYLHFSFPMSADKVQRQDEFEDLASLAIGMQRFMAAMSVNLFLMCILICIRVISMMTALIPHIGIAVNTILQVRYSLMAFGILFATMSCGFTFAGYYLFGANKKGFSTVTNSLISTIKMVMGESSYELLQEGDSDMASVFLVLFQLLFLIVQQVLLSVLIIGYFKERAILDQLQDADKYPLQRIWRMLKALVREHSTWINRCAVSLQHFFFGSQGSGTSRINYENVAKHRDRRATKPSLRNVLYEQKQDDENETDDIIAKDVTLKAVQPFYPGGLMNYYVEKVTPNGPAYDARVQPQAGFRLVEIQLQGIADRQRFRQPEVLQATKDPQKILKDLTKLPVTLVFEGKVPPASRECAGLMFYIAIFLCFILMVSRVGDSYSQHVIHESALVQQGWVSYNPRKEVAFDGIDSMGDVAQWVSAAVLDREYACATEIGDPSACSSTALNSNVRSGWFLWHGVGASQQQLPLAQDREDVRPLSYRPPAAEGLSVGFVPLTPPASSLSSEFICAAESSNQAANCPECVMGNACTCFGEVKYGYGANWSMWRPVDGGIQCATSVFGDPYPGQGKVCICRNATRQITQTVRMQEYNVGVMPNNHVRLTFQTPCFQANPEVRWAQGYRWRLDPAQAHSSGCAREACMQQAMEGEAECLDGQGEVQDKGRLRGERTAIAYEYARDGTYHDLGGFAVGFGNTRREAAITAELLASDNIFTRKAVSSVFETVTYNGNYDMFAYSTVAFSLKETGKLEKVVTTSVFPLNTFSMGSTESAKREEAIAWVCFVAYMLAAGWFTVHLLRDLSTQHSITKALLRPSYMFLLDFFTEDWWNIVDVCSVILSILVIQGICSFMLINSRAGILSGIESWTGKYAFDRSADLNTLDPVKEFERAALLYQRFNGIAAMQALLLIVRFVKYFGGFEGLRLVLTALSIAVYELILVILFFCTILLGLVLMVSTKFGVQFSMFSTVQESFVSLFPFLLGRFDVDTLINSSPELWLFIFSIYQVSLFLVLNMLLAAIVFGWKDARRDAQDFSLSSTCKAVGESLACAWKQQGSKDEDEEVRVRKLDADFWQTLSILRHINTLDEAGKLSSIRSHHQRSKHRGESGEDAERGGEEGGSGEHSDEEQEDAGGAGAGFNLENPEEHKKFLKAFRKAHMELASRMCRSVEAQRRDRGGGVGELLDEEGHASESERLPPEHQQQQQQQRPERQGAEDEGGFIGIVEEPQPDDKVEWIRRELQRRLEEADHLSEEIWLDALITVLEEGRALERLQGLFLPMPMVLPKKQQDWSNFDQKKLKMERRLDVFLKWLQEEARTKHFDFLRGMTESKERVLKQQSLVLTDYLETLDGQIQKLQEDIQDLESKNAKMRAPVAQMT